MRDNGRICAESAATYYPYFEPSEGAGKGLLPALAEEACVVVTDDFPCFFLPRMIESAARQVSVKLEAVDSNGLLPLKAAERCFPTAHGFRSQLQRILPFHLSNAPVPNPLSSLKLPLLDQVPMGIRDRWPPSSPESIEDYPSLVSSLPVDHSTPLAEGPEGGSNAAVTALDDFLAFGLDRYAEDHNHPDEEACSGLSPYLHFGHISSHEVFHALAEREEWFPDLLGRTARGKREGWWGMSPSAEAFLDQLVTWRELGFNFCFHREDYAEYGSLPEWARDTLKKHSRDPRPRIYSLDELASARTGDPVWNAAQVQLLREGRIHNYLRMVWGKRILEWTETPEEASTFLVELNNRYALDGRDPNSYTGLFWILGRYDRPWGPERKIFGKVRYMSSNNARRKLRMEEYLMKYSPDHGG